MTAVPTEYVRAVVLIVTRLLDAANEWMPDSEYQRLLDDIVSIAGEHRIVP